MRNEPVFAWWDEAMYDSLVARRPVPEMNRQLFPYSQVQRHGSNFKVS